MRLRGKAQSPPPSLSLREYFRHEGSGFIAIRNIQIVGLDFLIAFISIRTSELLSEEIFWWNDIARHNSNRTVVRKEMIDRLHTRSNLLLENIHFCETQNFGSFLKPPAIE